MASGRNLIKIYHLSMSIVYRLLIMMKFLNYPFKKKIFHICQSTFNAFFGSLAYPRANGLKMVEHFDMKFKQWAALLILVSGQDYGQIFHFRRFSPLTGEVPKIFFCKLEGRWWTWKMTKKTFSLRIKVFILIRGENNDQTFYFWRFSWDSQGWWTWKMTKTSISPHIVLSFSSIFKICWWKLLLWSSVPSPWVRSPSAV